jgi:hypothetical protein
MEMKTSELTGAALDLAVAKCENVGVRWSAPHEQLLIEGEPYSVWQPRNHWAQGGSIIEREGITLRCGLHGWDAELPEFDVLMDGPSALEAAMRCYVASKLGDIVDIPDNLF